MKPDFNTTTSDTLAKRAAFICSNPDCNVQTIGPNNAPTKSTSIGEAAHIRAARKGGARFSSEMTDSARASITNGIWLCRNCHGMIDKDPRNFSVEVLYHWREQHENSVASHLGSSVTSRYLASSQKELLEPFASYPAIVRRIVLDKPDGWEWSLTAALLRHLSAKHFQQISDLDNELYTKSLKHIDRESSVDWLRQQLSQMERLLSPLVKNLDNLHTAWGEPGEPGNIDKIHHSCKLLSDALGQVLIHEERIRFTQLSENFEPVREILQTVVSSQATKFSEIPSFLDEVVAYLDEHGPQEDVQPRTFKKLIKFELPNSWEQEFNKALEKAEKLEECDHGSNDTSTNWGCAFWFLILLMISFIYIF